MADKSQPPISETLEKGLRILDLFDRYHQGLRLTDIYQAVGLNKTTTYRFVNTYCRLGYLRRDPATKLFHLGPRSNALAYNVLQNSDLVEAVAPVVDKAHRRLELHIDVGLLHDDAIFVIYRCVSVDTPSFRHFISSRGLHFLATGKAVLAFLPPKERDRLIQGIDFEQKTEKTIASRQELLADLERTARRGYSLNNEEFVPGLIAIGAPVIHPVSSRVVGAVSFDSVTTRYSMTSFEAGFAREVVELGKEVAAVLPEF